MKHFLSERIDVRSIDDLRVNPGNARKHSRQQVDAIAKLIQRYGWTNPVLVSADGMVIAGHGRISAARKIGLTEVPTICLSHLSADELRAYALADNRIAERATWDNELLAIDLQYLVDIEFDLSLTAFEMGEIDLILDEAGGIENGVEEPAVPRLAQAAVTRAGDLWTIGQHRLLCGDAQHSPVYEKLVGAEIVSMLFTDPPYNVRIDGNVSGRGKHREFAFASGEMSEREFTAFLTNVLACASQVLRDGAIAYVCMDWRHMREMLDAGGLIFGPLKQLCVWNKSNAGLGTFYRSKHELIFIFKNGNAPHVNNFRLGEMGRHRSNVWDFPGMSSPGASRQADLADHPTVKPVQLIQDAILDCSNRNDLVLDCFGGSGSTLLAAERAGRRARLIEIDPLYCDTIIRRAADAAGLDATLGVDGPTFEQVAAERAQQKVA